MQTTRLQVYLNVCNCVFFYSFLSPIYEMAKLKYSAISVPDTH